MNPEHEADAPWEPAPVAAGEFHQPDAHANVNRAPYDEVSGVIYKRDANVKRVRYVPEAHAPDLPAPWQGTGETVIRWLFSELPGSEEALLAGATFAFLHHATLAPGARTGMHDHPGVDHVLVALAGYGELHHRPGDGSPVVVRPLRPRDAALVRGAECYRIANPSEETPLELLVLGLRRA
ncbi:MAG: cupin domain-containing protein [Anaerolineae bacterium]|nr:cupin domain-containing protein [Anaerolineae bacterium]